MARKPMPQKANSNRIKVTMKDVKSAPGGPGWQVMARPPQPLPPGIIVTKGGGAHPLKFRLRTPQRRG